LANQREKLSKYFKAEDIAPGAFVHLTIDRVSNEEVGITKEMKDVIYFREIPKGLVINKSNRLTLIMLYGDYDEKWVGKPITLYTCDTRTPTGLGRGMRILERGQASFKGLPADAEAFMYGA